MPHSTKYLYQTAQSLPWEELITLEDTFSIQANVANSKITHSRYASLCLKDAIVDQFRSKTGKRPNIDPREPDIGLNLFINRNKATISFDLAGRPLGKRGYRSTTVAAPIQESTAAAILELAEWSPSTPLWDPMCGSGTFICEAVMRALNMPAGYLHSCFGFQFLPEYDEDVFNSVRKKIQNKIKEVLPETIHASDIDGRAIATARENLSHLTQLKNVKFTKSDYRDLPPAEPTTIICNPPYGVRMNSIEDAKLIYKELGDFLKQKCTGSTAFIYCGTPQLAKAIGLKPAWKKPLHNGGVEGIIARIDLY